MIKVPIMPRVLRFVTSLFIALSFALVGGIETAGARMHADMADCPHAAAAARLAPDDPAAAGRHGEHAPKGPAMPLPSCCFALPAAGLAPNAPAALPQFVAAALPPPASDRLPAGDAPGPELPPPRS